MMEPASCPGKIQRLVSPLPPSRWGSSFSSASSVADWLLPCQHLPHCYSWKSFIMYFTALLSFHKIFVWSYLQLWPKIPRLLWSYSWKLFIKYSIRQSLQQKFNVLGSGIVRTCDTVTMSLALLNKLKCEHIWIMYVLCLLSVEHPICLDDEVQQ